LPTWFTINGVLTNFDSRAVRQSELSAKTGVSFYLT
jgi:hypothetical protein